MIALSYVSVLQNNLPESILGIYGDRNRPYILEQDNAPPHQAKSTKNYLPLACTESWSKFDRKRLAICKKPT